MSAEQRRSKRKSVDELVEVTDAMTGERVGRIGNLSIDGLMLVASKELREDALYQFSFPLPDARGHAVNLEVGVHEQWIEPGGPAGQCWAGFRIIDIAPQDFAVLKHYVDESD